MLQYDGDSDFPSMIRVSASARQGYLHVKRTIVTVSEYSRKSRSVNFAEHLRIHVDI